MEVYCSCIEWVFFESSQCSVEEGDTNLCVWTYGRGYSCLWGKSRRGNVWVLDSSAD